MKETQRSAERIIHELIPNISDMLDRPIIQSHELSEYYFARQVLEQVEKEFRQLKRNQGVSQERTGELQRQNEALKTELWKKPSHMGSPGRE